MTDQQKLYRVFRLIRLLSQPPYRTVKQLASILEVSPETAYRYIRLLESVGYNIDKKEGNRYFLFLDYEHDTPLIDLDEAGYLHDLQLTNLLTEYVESLARLQQEGPFLPIVEK